MYTLDPVQCQTYCSFFRMHYFPFSRKSICLQKTSECLISRFSSQWIKSPGAVVGCRFEILTNRQVWFLCIYRIDKMEKMCIQKLYELTVIFLLLCWNSNRYIRYSRLLEICSNPITFVRFLKEMAVFRYQMHNFCDYYSTDKFYLV